MNYSLFTSHFWRLHWRHMGAVTTQITVISTAYLTGSLTSHWRNSVSNHRHIDCLFNNMSGKHQRKHQRSKSLVLCEGNATVTGGLPSHRASDMESIFTSWRHRETACCDYTPRIILTLHGSRTSGLLPKQWGSANEATLKHMGK